jgi:Ca-activated chloride channel homolog
MVPGGSMYTKELARPSLSVLFVLLLFVCGCTQEQSTPNQSGRSGVKQNPKGTVELVFTYGSEKEKWVKDVTDAFQAAKIQTKSGKSIRVHSLRWAQVSVLMNF